MDLLLVVQAYFSIPLSSQTMGSVSSSIDGALGSKLLSLGTILPIL